MESPLLMASVVLRSTEARHNHQLPSLYDVIISISLYGFHTRRFILKSKIDINSLSPERTEPLVPHQVSNLFGIVKCCEQGELSGICF